MPKRLIHVKQEYIAQGIRRSSTSCPIALAVAEKVGTTRVIVGSNYVVIYYDPVFEPEPHRAHLSEKAQSFIARFDWEGPRKVQPFKFYLDVPK